MAARPIDTSPEAWAMQRAALARLGPGGRVAAAIDLSEAVRSIQISGLLARHPGWATADAVRYLVETQYGVRLPEPR